VPEKRVASIEFSGLSERTGPMTWPQHAIWSVISWEGEDAHLRNVFDVWKLPQDVTHEQIFDAFETLLRACETLRTTYRTDLVWPQQVVHGAGAVSVYLYEANPDDLAARTDEMVEQLLRVSFDIATGVPLVLGIVSLHGQPRRVVPVLSHLAIDAWSMGILHRMFEEVICDGPDAMRKYEGHMEQPIDLANFEQSPSGAAVAQSSIKFWRTAFSEIPTAMFAGGSESGARIERARSYSPELARAVREISLRDHISVSMVVMGAAALVLSGVLGVSDIAIRNLIATRLRSEAKHSVAALNLNGLFRLRIGSGPVKTHFRKSGFAALSAIQYSHCNPEELERELDAIMQSRGVTVKQYMFFNDRSSPLPDGSDEDAGTEDDDIAAGFVQGDDAEYQMVPDSRPDKDSKLLLEVVQMNHKAAILSLYLDRRFIPAGPIDVLRSIERVIIEAAGNPDADAPSLALASGLAEIPADG
jgi:hypothetical protein